MPTLHSQCSTRQVHSIYTGISAPTKSATEVAKAFQWYFGPRQKPGIVYTDNSKEFQAAFQKLEYLADTSTPHLPQTNGIAERSIRRIKEGTRVLLEQSGFNMVWWADAMRCYCFLRNIYDDVTTPDDKLVGTPYAIRFNEAFRGTVLPFGCYVEYIPNDEREKALQHTFDKTTVSGIFMGYKQRPGGFWSGDYLILPFSTIENTVSHQAASLRKIPDIVAPKEIIFPLKTGLIQFGTDLPDA